MNYSFNVNVATEIGVDGAIMLENLKFWIMKNKANEKNYFDGYYWTYNSTKAFSQLFPFWSEKQIRRILTKLEDEEYIKSGNYNKIAYDRTKWYTITEKGELLYNSQTANTILPNGQMEITKKENGTTEKVEPIPYINTDINKDINIYSDSSANKSNKEELESTIASIRSNYKGTKSKKVADSKLPKLIKQYGEEQLIRAIERYNDYVFRTRKTGFDLKFKNESTWWNGAYMDYLDINFTDTNSSSNAVKTQSNINRPKENKPAEIVNKPAWQDWD